MNILNIEVPSGNTCEKCKFFEYYSYSGSNLTNGCKLFETDIKDKEKCFACRLLSRNEQTNQSEEFDKVIVKTEKKEQYIKVKDLDELLLSKCNEYLGQCMLNEYNNEYSAESARWQTVRDIMNAVDKLKRV